VSEERSRRGSEMRLVGLVLSCSRGGTADVKAVQDVMVKFGLCWLGRYAVVRRRVGWSLPRLFKDRLFKDRLSLSLSLRWYALFLPKSVFPFRHSFLLL